LAKHQWRIIRRDAHPKRFGRAAWRRCHPGQQHRRANYFEESGSLEVRCTAEVCFHIRFNFFLSLPESSCPPYFSFGPILMVLTSLAEKRRATLPVQNQRQNHATPACHADHELKNQADSDITIGASSSESPNRKSVKSRCRLQGGIPTFLGVEGTAGFCLVVLCPQE
jgi:hypothetical protein